MNIQLRISEQYKGDKQLKELIDNLPDSFTSANEVLWNGRNKIRAFKIEDGKEAVVKNFFIKRISHGVTICLSSS